LLANGLGCTPYRINEIDTKINGRRVHKCALVYDRYNKMWQPDL